MSSKFYPRPTPHGWVPKPGTGMPMRSAAVQLTSAGSSLTDLGVLLGDPELAWLRARAALRDECEGPESLAAMLGLPFVAVDAAGVRYWVRGEPDG